MNGFGLPPVKMQGAALPFDPAAGAPSDKVAPPTKAVTVAELIRRLSEFPADARVVIPGYERGMEDIDAIGLVEAFVGYHGYDMGVYAPHESVSSAGRDRKCDRETMLLIGSAR